MKKQPEHKERAHHPFSPSKLGFIEECPCYESADTTSEAAKRGTKQHEAVELEEDNYLLQDHEALAVASCVEYAEQIKSEYKGKVLEFKEGYWPIDGNRIKIGKDTFNGTTAGYADLVYVAKDYSRADVLDWKFGAFEVTDASENLQGMSYLLGVVRKFPRLPQATVHFPMPHRDELTTHTFVKEDFPKMYLRIKQAVHKAIRARGRGFKDATPSASPCLFCKHLAVCPKATQLVIDLGRKVEPLEVPKEVTPEFIADPVNAAVGLRLTGVVKKWAEHYRTTMNNKAIEELDFVPDGYTLVTGQRREVRSVRGVLEVAGSLGLTQEELDSTTEVALTKIGAILKAKAPRGSKGAAEEEFSNALLDAGYVEKGAPYGYLKQSKGVKRKSKQTIED